MAYRTQVRLGVKAPPAAVWAAMEDFARWADWNPFYVEARGEMRIGAALDLRRVLAGQSQDLQAAIVDWVPGEQLVWRRTIGPFARSLGYIEIEGLTPQASIITIGEIFMGLIGERVGKGQRRQLKEGMQALGEALKARSEESWDGQPDLSVVPPAPVHHPKKPKGPAQPMQMSIFGRRGPPK
jgi:hypothetical protein